MKVTKQAKEAQLQQIFRMLLEGNKTQEQIANQLNINMRTVQRYTQEIDKRYGEMQRQKTDDTLFTECQIFKNRMLNLYTILENKASDLKTSGTEAAKCAEIAANIAIDVLKMESEGIRAVRELVGYGKGQNNRLLQSIQSGHNSREGDTDEQSRDTNNTEPITEREGATNPTLDDDRKF
jgi:hypothetical protein